MGMIERRMNKTEEQIQGKLGTGRATVASPIASSSHTQKTLNTVV